jgi:TonB family protein
MQAIRKLTLAATLVAGTAAATALPATAQAQAVPPRPLEHAQPVPPQSRSGMPVEGWVVLRYTVLADGRTADIRVVDRMPPQLSEREAVSAVEDWTFEPATNDGTAIEWHNNESVIVFDDDTVPMEPSPPFLQAYLEVDDLIKGEEHGRAHSRNERMLATVTSRLAEVGLAQVQSALINVSLGDVHAAYAAIRRATDPRIPVLGAEELKLALQYRNALELELGDAIGALETFARRTEIEPVPDNDVMASRAAAIEEALNGDAAIVIKAKVVDDYWRHTPARRTFAIADVNGDLDRIQVECDRRGAELPYAPDSEWSLPESWGACSLMVEGRRDTEFLFYEFP